MVKKIIHDQICINIFIYKYIMAIMYNSVSDIDNYIFLNIILSKFHSTI